MSLTQDELVAKFNTVTNAISVRLAGLVARVSAADTALAAKFQPLIDHLDALGNPDAADPVPELPAAT